MQVVDHITICPLLNQERGLEPYPQPLVCFTSAVSGTVQVRIYDTSVQPMVELTTSALSGAELSAVTATGLTYAYTLDMGHANVTSVVDLMNREGFEGVVMFEDTGSGQKIYVKISANTQEQVAFLYPDNAVYLDRNSASTGTNFPDGSIFRPVNLIADACSLVTSRGADVLDVVGNFTPSTDEWTHAKIGTTLEGKQIRCRPGKSGQINSHDANGLSLDGCHIKGFNRNLSLRNDTNNNSGFEGGIVVEDCNLWNFGSNGNSGTFPVIKNCFIERMVDGFGDPPIWIDCEFGNIGYVDIGDYGNHRYARFIRPSGEKLTIVGNYQGSTRYLSITDVKGMLPIDISISVRNGTNITVTGAYGELVIGGLSHSQPPVVTTSKLAGLDDLTGNVVNLAAGSITPTEAPNLDVAVSSVGGGGGAASAIDVSDHIRTCPLLNQQRGLEPYPQPLVTFAAAPTGTVQARIYDTSVQPMVELTSTALSGAELTLSTAAGLSHTYVLDMGHANVTAVVDAMNREGLEALVMIEDNGGTQGQKFVKVTCNDPEHIRELYPDNAVYLDRNASSSATTFPNGSIYQPVNLIADACSLVTSRGADILDVVGLFTPATDQWTHTKIGTSLHRKQIRCRPGQSARIQNTDINGLSLDGCHIKGFNRNLSLRNDINNSSLFRDNAAGGLVVEDCQLWNFGSYGGIAAPIIKNCFIERTINGQGDPPYFIDCEFGTLGFVDLGGFAAARYARFIRPSGEKLTLTGNYQGSSRYLTITDVQGMLPIEILVTIRNGTNITVTGAYGSLQIDGLTHSSPPNVVATRKLAGLDDLTGNVVNLAAGSITPTEAPNLDVAVSSVGGGGGGGTDWTSTEKEQIRQRLSLDGTQADPTTSAGDFETLLTNIDATVSSRSAFNAAADSVTVGTNNDKTGYAMAGTLQSLDALDTAQDAQHATTQADLATVDGLVDTLVARLTAARAGNLDNLDAAITTLATSAALGTVDTNVDTLIARLTAGRATNLDNLDAAITTLATSSALSSVASDVSTVLTRVGTDDIAILKGMLLGNYVLDGGAGAADISYDTNGHAATQRIRVFADSAATTAATKGAANGADSEIARVDITSAAVSGKPFPKNVTGTLT